MITDLNAFFLLASAKTRAITNYLSRRLDFITKLEVALFVSFLGLYLFNQINLSLNLLIKSGHQVEAWSSFWQITKSIFALFFVGGFAYERRQRGNPQVAVLFVLPISINSLVLAILTNIIVPLLLFLPFIITGTILFSAKLSIPWFNVILILLVQILSIAAFTLLGAGGAMVLNERGLGANRNARRFFFIILASISFEGLIGPWQVIGATAHTLLGLLFACVILVLSLLLVRGSISARITHNPESLWHSAANRSSRRGYKLLLKWYLKPMPQSLAPLVGKDTLFAIRSYKSFVMLFGFFAVAISLLILLAKNPRDAAQWLLSLCIAASYFLANAAFKFNEEGIELMQLIRANPVSARRFWWAKFWVGFLPNLWLISMGHLLFLSRHFAAWRTILPGLTLILFIAFTLIFVQNNFSLYSYPYSRYAPLWYNLYVIVAAGFFTVLLFPPLSLAFLLFGFYAIFRVQRRFDSMEVLV
jgi:hypothetical protein